MKNGGSPAPSINLSSSAVVRDTLVEFHGFNVVSDIHD
jgi:hypothetical protein